MSVLNRLAKTIKANLNAAIDHIEDRQKLLEQTLWEIKDRENLAKKKLVEMRATQKIAQKRAKAYAVEAAKWEQSALTALAVGEEEKAKVALANKQRAESLQHEEEQTAALIGEQGRALQGALAELPARVAQLKRESLTQNSLSNLEAFETFDRMVEKVELSEAGASAWQELNEEKTARATSEKVLRGLDVDDALAKLKGRLQSAGSDDDVRKRAAEIEAELAKIKSEL